MSSSDKPSNDPNDSAKRRSNQFRLWREVRIPFLSVLVGLAGVLSGVVFQWHHSTLEAELKREELTQQRAQVIGPKAEAYSKYVQAVELAYRNAQSAEWDMKQGFGEMERAFLSIEPFITEQARATLWKDVWDYQIFCKDVWTQRKSKPDEVQRMNHDFVERRERMKSALRGALFQ